VAGVVVVAIFPCSYFHTTPLNHFHNKKNDFGQGWVERKENTHDLTGMHCVPGQVFGPCAEAHPLPLLSVYMLHVLFQAVPPVNDLGARMHVLQGPIQL
jgi:hypothetical protein